MRFLLDENLALSYAEGLRGIGFDAQHVIEVGLDQTKDEIIVAFARMQGMTIITFDLDHTKIVALSGDYLPSILTFRLTQISKAIFIQFFEDHFINLKSSIEKGALITIDDNGIRIRELPVK